MLTILSRTLVVLLLVVDWAEDPHYGQYLFTTPMASTDVSPLDLGFQHGDNHEQHQKSPNPVETTSALTQMPAFAPALLVEEDPIRIDHSCDSTVWFMSWQI